jgi:phosphatidate cytidylyltransferase
VAEAMRGTDEPAVPGPGSEELSPGGRSLRQAVVTALVLLALVAVCAYLGTTAFFVLVCAVVLTALFEVYDAIVQAGGKPSVVLGMLAGFGMLLGAFFERPAILAVVVALTMYAAFVLALRPGRGSSASTDVAWTLLGAAWIGGGGAGATSILKIDDSGLFLLIGYVLVTAIDDIGAYFVGVSLGKHKMAPSISPGKSWEGFLGGTAAALLAGLAFGALTDDLTLVDGLALGAISALLAPVGDLVESMFKREMGIKDSGRLLPGHGGLLDRLDAILFCAPAAYLYLRFVAL